MKNFTPAKIVSTLGPATDNEDMIRKLYKAGVTMFRLNSSHGDVKTHSNTLKIIRKIEKEQGAIIPVLLDLQGPKIRIGELEKPIIIKSGEILKFKHTKKFENNIIPVDYKGIANDVKPGEKILIDDGKIQLIVKKVQDDIVYAENLTSGVIKPRKGLNIPGSTGSVDILTKRDLEFIDFALNNDIDYLGLSFVRDENDVMKLREILCKNNSKIRIISKIEKPQAVKNIDGIIDASDGIMVARGDLGIEIETQKVPIVQKTIIKKANIKRKPVIVATQMLESMVDNPIPTRAETSDVANAIIDGADAVMLSGETTVGKYPVETVNIMKKIAEDIENSPFVRKNNFLSDMKTGQNKSETAIALSIADIVKFMPRLKCIVALTATGYTPALISECRPSVPLYAPCHDLRACRCIKLYRGVIPVLIPDTPFKLDKESIDALNKFLKDKLKLKSGDIIILTGSLPHVMSGGSTNFLKIHTVE